MVKGDNFINSENIQSCDINLNFDDLELLKRGNFTH